MPEQKDMTFWDHLEALRWMILRCLAALAVFLLAGFIFVPWIFDHIVMAPCRDDFFLKLMRENEYARECIKQAVFEVTGVRCNIGPHKRAVKEETAEADPLAQFIETLDLPEDRVQID